MSFDNLGLDARLMQAVASMGYAEPTPIQSGAIPLVLAGRDVVGCAQTGTGKTAAFVLPTLQRITARKGAIAALVVTPTRELALQIEEVAKTASKSTRHRVAVVYGGVGYEPQRRALSRASTCSSPPPAACSTWRASATSTSAASRSSSSTRPTACSTRASGPT